MEGFMLVMALALNESRASIGGLAGKGNGPAWSSHEEYSNGGGFGELTYKSGHCPCERRPVQYRWN